MSIKVPTKPSASQRKLLIWLTDHPNCLLISSSSLSHTSIEFEEPRQSDGTFIPYNGDDNYSIPKNTGIHLLLRAGWIKEVNKRAYGDKVFSWYDHPYEIIEAGKKIANELRSEQEEEDRKKLEDRSKVERLIAIRSDGYDHHEFETLCLVTRETSKRLYVEVVKKRPGSYFSPTSGYGENMYVNRDQLSADNITEKTFDRLTVLEKNQKKWEKELDEQLEAELEPIRKRYEDRKKQNAHQFKDEIKEIIK